MNNKVGVEYRQIRDAENIESILCLATLIAVKELKVNSTVWNSKSYYDALDNGCDTCLFNNICLSCIINEF